MSTLGPIASIRVKSQVIENCWNYVFENFGKFSPEHKLKVILAIIPKDMPTKVEGDITKGPTQIVVIRSKEEIADRVESISGQISVQPS